MRSDRMIRIYSAAKVNEERFCVHSDEAVENVDLGSAS